MSTKLLSTYECRNGEDFVHQISKERKTEEENGHCFLGKLQEEAISSGLKLYLLEEAGSMCATVGARG